MRQKWCRSILVSIAIALLIHVIILYVLFRGLVHYYTIPPLEDRDVDQDVKMPSGRPGPQVFLHHPTQRSLRVLDISAPAPASSRDASGAATIENTVEKSKATSLGQLHENLGGGIDEEKVGQESDAGLRKVEVAKGVPAYPPLHEKARNRRVATSRANKKRAAIEALQQLSFSGIGTSASAGTNHYVITGSMGFGNDTNHNEQLAWRIYSHKVFSIAVRAINTDGVKIDLPGSVSYTTDLCIVIARNGHLVDVYLKECPPTAVLIEQAIRDSIKNSGLYPRVPRYIKGDSATLTYPVHIEGRPGIGIYRIEQVAQW